MPCSRSAGALSFRSTAHRALRRRAPGVIEFYRSNLNRERRFPFRRRFAAPSLHHRIKSEFEGVRGGVYFEAGANDGFLHSNTAYLARYEGWTGILVEPVPHKFVQCLSNRPESAVEHCALVPPSYEKEYVRLEFSDLTSFVPDLADADASNRAEAGLEYLMGADRNIMKTTFLTPARTIDQVLEKHQVKQIDFMSLDLEGAELMALRGLTFERYRIDRILVEARDVQSMDDVLCSRGYVRKDQWDSVDYLYVRA